MDVGERACNDLNWFELAKDRDHSWTWWRK